MSGRLRKRYGRALSAVDQTCLADLKAERKALIGAYGDKGQRHPMAKAIGGLNPAASRLFAIRGEIARLEKQGKPPAPRLTPIEGHSGFGLRYHVDVAGRRGTVGLSAGAPPHLWYVVEGGDIVTEGHKTAAQAAKAFAATPRRP